MPVPARASELAHAGLALCNPLSPALLDAAVAALGPLEGVRVLDVGCAKGDLLARLLAAGAATAVGVDLSPAFTDAARSLLGPDATVVTADARSWDAGPAYDVVCCVGATHALADSVWSALPRLRALAREGGQVLLGEGFWRRAPDPAYLAALGAVEDELASVEVLRARLADAGLPVAWSAYASEEDWERYESAWAGNLRRYAGTHPDDPDAAAMQTLADVGWNRFARWGRETLGFGLFVCSAQAIGQA